MHTNSGTGGANRPVGDSSRRCHHCCFEDSSRQPPFLGKRQQRRGSPLLKAL